MSKSRNIADLLDSSGDVKSGALDNVPASDDASSLTTGTIPIARIADDAVVADKLANSINTDIATGVTANTTANAALPKAGGTMTGNISHGDDVKGLYGTGSDLEIYHDGSDSYLKDNGIGNLILKTNGTKINLYDGAQSNTMADFSTNGSCDLYYAGSKKIETTNTGVDITGAISGATNLGKVLQVVDSNVTGGFTSSTSSYADTGLSASITPTATSSYILVHIYANGVKHNGNNQMGMKMFRGSTELEEWKCVSGYSDNTEGSVTLCFKDTPSTTSSTTYKIQANRKSGSGTVRINNDVADGYSMQSSIVLMEIAG